MPLSVRSYWILIYAVFGPHMLTNNQIMYAPLFGNDFILENIFLQFCKEAYTNGK